MRSVDILFDGVLVHRAGCATDRAFEEEEDTAQAREIDGKIEGVDNVEVPVEKRLGADRNEDDHCFKDDAPRADCCNDEKLLGVDGDSVLFRTRQGADQQNTQHEEGQAREQRKTTNNIGTDSGDNFDDMERAESDSQEENDRS